MNIAYITNKFKVAGIASLTLLLAASCSDILDEQPRASFDPSYFSTEAGIEGGITAMYAHLRYIFGQGYFFDICETGTDEATYGQNADMNFFPPDLTDWVLTADNSRSDVLWNQAFTNINTCSGVLENGEAAGMDEALLAEAHFFRAFDYFYLVQTFGGVPLDLGAGELAFNTSTSRISVRNTVPEVYTKGVFPDMLTAIENLPTNPRVTGGVTKNVARLFLAKAYLTYAWWLKNPNNISTYPECTRTDPDGHDYAWYFQEAYNYAVEAINNPGPYALQNTFYEVNAGYNDRNSEIMLYADHTEDSEYYNGGSLTYGTGAAPDNFAGWMMQWNYPEVRVYIDGNAQNPIIRVAVQGYGRPWFCMAPPHGVFYDTFADKTHDSRYDGTFDTVYRGNWSTNGETWESVPCANGISVKEGEPIITFLDEDEDDITWDDDSNYVGAGTIAGRSDWVLPPSAFSRHIYPGLWKLGPYRTDNGTGTGSPNAGSTRPYSIAKFSELYLIAAEAAVEGATTQSGMGARDLVLVLRARAGKWMFSNALNEEYVADYSQEMIDDTPADIDLDYILAERSREFFGEGYRWYDLVRTQKWNEYADSYTICGNDYGDHTPVTYYRTIEDYHYLRPIPTTQMDGMEMTTEEKKAYQNPGYN
ncbi:MAG: RagB/SusD family nutrient uptake outer membrane protein [Prevotellaceae bacterium]|nr:RagB/SusD family nutrient uptake outer membrane protein [Prevotellaceae bacterium]